jgi:cysteine desulfurase family protein (TIGR01976 family)
VYFDGPAGTQVPQRTILAMVRYLSTCNANYGGAFASSVDSDHILRQAHEWTADFFNARAPEEVIFGPNMTTLTFQLSRAIGKTLRPGDEVIVTRLDHDANITPWVLAAADAGAAVKWVDIRPDDCTLDMDDLRRQLSERTKLVAVTCASNAVGTVVDVAEVVRLAHAAGAWAYVDAVHFAPHRLIDVQAWGCDFLTCSAYKFFGPHVGILWGRRELLEELPAYKVRPAPDAPPAKWMTGTQNHEGLAGLCGTLDYLLDVGSQNLDAVTVNSAATLRRLRFGAALAAIQQYETDLARRLLQALAERPRFKVWGIADPARIDQRVPTVSFTQAEKSPAEIARHLAERDICAWAGNNYALALTERLGVEDNGGFLRVGLVHYNTAEEVDTLIAALDEL